MKSRRVSRSCNLGLAPRLSAPAPFFAQQHRYVMKTAQKKKRLIVTVAQLVALILLVTFSLNSAELSAEQMLSDRSPLSLLDVYRIAERRS